MALIKISLKMRIMKSALLLILISVTWAIPVKDVRKQLAVKALMELITEVEMPEPAYGWRHHQVKDQVEFSVPYCPEGASLSGTAFQILRQTIADVDSPVCPKRITKDACEDYSHELRKCIMTRIPDFIDKIRKEKFILTEEEKHMLTQSSMNIGLLNY